MKPYPLMSEMSKTVKESTFSAKILNGLKVKKSTTLSVNDIRICHLYLALATICERIIGINASSCIRRNKPAEE